MYFFVYCCCVFGCAIYACPACAWSCIACCDCIGCYSYCVCGCEGNQTLYAVWAMPRLDKQPTMTTTHAKKQTTVNLDTVSKTSILYTINRTATASVTKNGKSIGLGEHTYAKYQDKTKKVFGITVLNKGDKITATGGTDGYQEFHIVNPTFTIETDNWTLEKVWSADESAGVKNNSLTLNAGEDYLFFTWTHSFNQETGKSEHQPTATMCSNLGFKWGDRAFSGLKQEVTGVCCQIKRESDITITYDLKNSENKWGAWEGTSIFRVVYY